MDTVGDDNAFKRMSYVNCGVKYPRSGGEKSPP
jgi:hypothetical protein